jgi:N-acetylmuramoyl-L-alanine amidase
MASFRQRCRGRFALAAGLFVLLAPLVPPARGAASARDLAAERYRYARLLLEDLNAVPAVELGEEQYLLVIDAFQKVHRTSPASSHCDDALLDAAQLYREMIGRFGPERYREKSIAAYQFLIREYPHSKLLDAARQAIDEIEKGAPPPERRPAPAVGENEVEVAGGVPNEQPPLADPAAGASPPQAADAVATGPGAEALPVAILSSRSVVLPVSDKPKTANRRASRSQVDGVRFWTHPDYTRVIVELGDRVEISYDQLRAPKRLFFDLMETQLGEQLTQESSFEVGDSYLKRIRIAQFARRSTRVVFDLERAVYFDVAWLSNPARLVVEVRDRDEPTLLSRAAPDSPPAAAETRPAAQPARVEETGGLAAKPAPLVRTPGESGESFARALDQGGENPKSARATDSTSAGSSQGSRSSSAAEAAAPPAAKAAKAAAPLVAKTETPKAAEKAPVEIAKVTPPPPPMPDLAPPKAAAPNAKGQRSLIRALGLKVGRVVIDAGHGGHDPGTIGPGGLQEKDLVLDVALRLGKLIEEGLGSEVIQTRDDDRFLSHKERTKLANERQADLFVSIHANSSLSRKVRGIETYFLNFTTDSWALTVASRENAASDRSVHELQDLLSKIALKEKIEESQEFASRIQQALHSGLSEDTAGLRNRGVRKAPFLVLIGAKMPAVLAEIGFISNPSTEKLLKTGAYRQKVANHLYQGILSYAESLGNISLARSQTGEAVE